MFKFFYPNSECCAKYDTFCSHIFNYACVRRKVYSYRRGSKLWKICMHRKHFWKWLVGGCIPLILFPGFAPGHKLQKPPKDLAYFSHLASSVVFLLSKRQSQRGGGHGTMAPLLNTLLRAGFKQWEALGYWITLIGRAKKRSSRPQMSRFHWKYWYSEEQNKVYTSSDVLFSTESNGEEKKTRS